jgi:hypothetical protein
VAASDDLAAPRSVLTAEGAARGGRLALVFGAAHEAFLGQAAQILTPLWDDGAAQR